MIASKESLEEAAACLCDGLEWRKSPEGYEFWAAVHSKLALLGQGKPATASEVVVPLPLNQVPQLGVAALRKRVATTFARLGKKYPTTA